MKIKTALAAAALLVAGIGLSPASAQMSPPNGMHNDGPGRGDHGRPGMGSPGRDMHHGRDMRGDRGHGWKRPHHKRCRTVWRNHHRVKRCY